MKEEQNYQKESEQLNFLNGTIKKNTNKKEKDQGGRKSSKLSEEPVETLKIQDSLANILILDTETTGLDSKNDECLDFRY